MWIQKDNSEETLQGSWVELHFKPADLQGGAGVPGGQGGAGVPGGQGGAGIPGGQGGAGIPGGQGGAGVPGGQGGAGIPGGQGGAGVPGGQGGAGVPGGQGGAGIPGGQGQTPAGLEPDLEKMLLDAQHESSRSSSKGSSQSNSPLRSETPPHLYRGSGTSSQSEEDDQERRGEEENVMKSNADGIWHWSSRPENNPPREFQLKHPRRSSGLSIRNTSVMKKGGVLSPDFLKLFLPSLILSHILAVGLGVYIGRRLSAPSAY